MQEPKLVASPLAPPTIQFALNASATLRRVFDLPTNADVARHLDLDPGHYSRVQRQQAEVSAQLLGRLLVAMVKAGEHTTDVIEVVDADGTAFPVDLAWERTPSAAAVGSTRRLAS